MARPERGFRIWLPIDQLPSHDSKEDTTILMLVEGLPAGHVLSQEFHPRVVSIMLQNVENDEFSFMDFSTDSWTEKTTQSHVFVVGNGGEGFIPGLAVQTGENGAQVSRLE